jgi:serine/threonine protein kinase
MMESFTSPKPFGPYFLHAKIAQGGMSDVFLATSSQKELADQFLAIKKLLPHLNSNRPFVNLLIHEAKIGVLLTHPCIATVFDLGSHQSEFFLAMEYVHGKSLDRLLSMISKQNATPLTTDLCCYIIIEVLRGLAFAHQLKDVKNRELNIVHRDVTPGNILISYLGEIKIADFGIATAENRLQPGFTSTAMGKVAYIAPEQAVNDPTTRASDIYSLGVVFHQLITGQLPYQGTSPNEIFKKVLQGTISDKLAGKVSTELRSLILQALNRSIKERPESCPDFFNKLAIICAKDFDADFSDKAVRLNYQNKLSEYMRKTFSKDIADELTITKRALSQAFVAQSVDPTPLGAHDADFGNEKTVFEADLSNEHTRHYPLDEAARKKMLDDVENDKNQSVTELAVDDEVTLNYSQEETQAAFNRPDPEAVSISKSISVEKKLQLSKLSKDEKESLKDLAPQIEITSPDALQEFEVATFADSRPHSRVALKTRAAEEAARPAKAKNEKSNFVETTKPAAGAEKTPRKKPDRDDARAPRKFSLVVTIRTRMPMLKSWLETARKIVMYGAIFSVVAWAFWVGGKKLLAPSQPWRGNLRDEKKVFLQFLGEASQQTLQSLTSSMKDPVATPNLAEVEQLFAREYKRYTGTNLKVIQFELSNYPISMFDGLTKQTNVSQLLTTDAIFPFLKQKGAEATVNYDSTIYVYYYPFEGEQNRLGFPDEFAGEHMAREGVVFAPAHLSQRLRALESIAREVAKIYGATDKIDTVTRMPLNPIGFANPKEKNLYPQMKAELMGKDVPLSPIQKRSITSISEIVIGPETAFELGWINRATRDRLIKN